MALEIAGEESVARFAEALPSPVFDQYAKALEVSEVSAIAAMAAVRRRLLRRLDRMSARLRVVGRRP